MIKHTTIHAKQPGKQPALGSRPLVVIWLSNPVGVARGRERRGRRRESYYYYVLLLQPTIRVSHRNETDAALRRERKRPKWRRRPTDTMYAKRYRYSRYTRAVAFRMRLIDAQYDGVENRITVQAGRSIPRYRYWTIYRGIGIPRTPA